LFLLNSEAIAVSEPSVNKHRRNEEAEERLAKQYRDIGIKAVVAAVK
jgi:hypothetical protein